MDDIDIKIIKLLQNNARMTVSEISSRVNLSIPAVSDRFKKLESTGIIQQYTAIVNPAKVQKDLMAIMFISLERPQYTDSFAEFIKDQKDILECHYLAGDYDYALKIITDNTATLELLLNKIKSVQGVQKTKTSVVLSTIKNAYSITPEV